MHVLIVSSDSLNVTHSSIFLYIRILHFMGIPICLCFFFPFFKYEKWILCIAWMDVIRVKRWLLSLWWTQHVKWKKNKTHKSLFIIYTWWHMLIIWTESQDSNNGFFSKILSNILLFFICETEKRGAENWYR